MKTADFSETIEACDLKVGRYRQLIDFMKVSIEGQGHYLTLAQGRILTKIQTGFSQKLLGHSELNLYESFQVQGNENLLT